MAASRVILQGTHLPTTAQEVSRIKEIVDRHVHSEHREALFEQLNEHVGKPSNNLSVKVSMAMMHKLYESDGKSFEEKAADLQRLYESYPNSPASPFWWQVALVGVVVVHFLALLGMVYSFFALPLTMPFQVWLPLCVVILNIFFTRLGEFCSLTKAEDAIRRRLGMKPVKLFIAYYWKLLFSESESK